MNQSQNKCDNVPYTVLVPVQEAIDGVRHDFGSNDWNNPEQEDV
jgi:hypothetical protein